MIYVYKFPSEFIYLSNSLSTRNKDKTFTIFNCLPTKLNWSLTTYISLFSMTYESKKLYLGRHLLCKGL
ncbi:hypothetical protein JHK82_032710 [Glycine max]|uniref:Uncharacterized protein n=2 Tax=Glycine subgen. Soja TaxID=1462606 RepID=K7LSV5_SOYBN|nr:hypothetical protein JHK87_032647 [Glycine soja]KAG4979456.1 hypothetical protein JHK85_033414 [Glycine max]KAG4985108.1 hypothetical protein JHK86_032799 [Glycine max]KAG5118290.1 hypothetical protein JHK82_032710 [Glycine max]KAG5139273.1 hypothetical protein JHK84_033041 [Glycine max]